MIVFGAVLLILALIVIAYVWLATAGMSQISIDYGVLNVELSPLWFFFAGGITLAVATSGLWLMGVGAKTSARKAKEVRELRRQAKESDRRTERDGDRAGLGRRSGASHPDRAAGGPGGGSTSRAGSSAVGGTSQAAAGTGTGSAPRSTGSDSGQQPILPRSGRDQIRGTGDPGAGAGGSGPDR
ncbi:hypothetical protein [Ornithinimicrobium sufpigmenti]|uniref:hypothetical protein n=1 Tax=Ornithinimicrobium sufpigmenti TaxID=2508882 RepID=UPI001036BA23|nr:MULTISPECIES: hypothetical protein [unclassified Ornithinimicrobium]